MTSINKNRAGWTDGKTSKLLMVLGEQHVWAIKNLILKTTTPRVGVYLFAFIFESVDSVGRETGVHKQIQSIEFGKEFYSSQFKTYLTPTSAIFNKDFTLDAYDRLRRIGRRGETPYPEYTRLES